MDANKNLFRKSELLKYIGDMSQIADAREYTITSGMGRGVRAIEVNNGSGLRFTVLPSRGMDISYCSYNQHSISYISQTGIVAPSFFNKDKDEFLRNFYGGLLTTCGLSNVGFACDDEGRSYGLHGRISNIEAEDVNITKEWNEDQYTIEISGKVREACFFGEYFMLYRKIRTVLGRNTIYIDDTVHNNSFTTRPLMVLYHFNFGYPLLDKNSELLLSNCNTIIPMDEYSKNNIENYTHFSKPFLTPQQAFILDLTANSEGYNYVGLINRKLGLGCYLKINKHQFNELVEWKMMNSGEYTLGIEPILGSIYGRASARKNNTLYMIEPGGKKDFNLSINILENNNTINNFEETSGLKHG